MTKRQTKKAAYKAIVKNNVSHQEIFDKLSKESELDTESLADEIAKIPSAYKAKKHQIVRFIYIGVLGLIIIMRTLGITALGFSQNFDITVLVIAVLIGLIIPALGIYGALTSRIDDYRTTGIFLLIGIFNSFSKGQITSDLSDILVLLPFIAAIALAFFIPTQLKTPYTKKVATQESEGVQKKSIEYIFEIPKNYTDIELLDVDLK